MLIDSTHFAAELAVAAQALAAAEIKLQIARAALSDIVCGGEARLTPQVAPDLAVVPWSPPTRVGVHRREEFTRFLGSYLASGVEQPVQEIYRAWHEQAPEVKISSVRTWLCDMLAQGDVLRRPIGRRDGVYSLPPVLRVLAEGD